MPCERLLPKPAAFGRVRARARIHRAAPSGLFHRSFIKGLNRTEETFCNSRPSNWIEDWLVLCLAGSTHRSSTTCKPALLFCRGSSSASKSMSATLKKKSLCLLKLEYFLYYRSISSAESPYSINQLLLIILQANGGRHDKHVTG